MRRLLSVLLAGLLMVACANSDDPSVAALRAVQDGALLIDVRTAEEFAGGHLPGAINIPHGEIVAGIAALETDRDQAIVLYCRSGNRSGIAQTSLAGAGYDELMNAGAYETLKPVWDKGS